MPHTHEEFSSLEPTHIGGYFSTTHKRLTPHGYEVIYEGEEQNQLYNEGQFIFLDVTLRNGTAPAQYNIGLFSTALAALPSKNSTLATLAVAGPYELTAINDPGYTARPQINRDATAAGWPILSLSAGDEQATSKTVVFTALADWADTVRWMFLTTNGTVGDTTGKLVSIARFRIDRPVLVNDVIDVTYNLKAI